jgi:hypothetical protein
MSLTMAETRADEYRRWAAQCLSFADQAELEDDKATWLEAAGAWLQRGQEADRSGSGRTGKASGGTHA